MNEREIEGRGQEYAGKKREREKNIEGKRKERKELR